MKRHRQCGWGLSPQGTVFSHRFQRGYLLITVVVALFLLATVAVLLTHDSAISANTSSNELEAARAEYVAQAGMQHALWRTQNNTCMGDVTIPATTLGTDSYAATVTGAAAGTFYTLTVDQDAWIRNDDVTKNNGATADQHIRFESGNTEHAMTRFDLAALPAGAQINSAIASFYVSIAGATGGIHPEGSLTVHRVTADWTELGATWETMGGNFESSILATIPAQDQSGVWVSINLTAQVQAWANGQPNYGILMASTAEGVHGKYASREFVANRPRLEVVVGSGSASPVTIQATGTLDNGVNRTLNRPLSAAYQPPVIYTFRPDAAESEDSEIWDQAPNNNYGDADETWVSSASSDTTRTLLRFNTGAIPSGARILEASLSLHRQSGAGADQPVSAHRITNGWKEDEVTWNERKTGKPWDVAGADFDNMPVATTPVGPANQRYDWNITPLVQGWVDGSFENDGVALVAAIDGMPGERFDTSDHIDPTRRPSLAVTYACECGSACMAPQGSGNVLMVVDSTSSPWGEDIYKRDLLESWGYTVTMLADGHGQSTFDSAIAANDVILVSETIASTDLGTKLGNPAIGIVNTDGWMNDELGFESANSSNWPVGRSIDITDTSHYITAPFVGGALDIYDVDMGGLAIDNTAAPDLQPLADWPTGAGLATLDTGAMTAGGSTTAGRRVMLPFGRDPSLYWPKVNNNGHLILKRAIAWTMGADKAGAGKKILLVVGNATTLISKDQDRKTLFESWGHTVTLIDDGDSQANFDTAMAANDVVYVTDGVSGPTLVDKVTNTTTPVVNEKGSKLGNFGFSSSESGTVNAASFTTSNAAHYITEPFSGNPVTVFSSSLSMSVPSGTLAPDLQTVGGVSGAPALVTLETGATLWNSGSAPARRVHLPLGAANVSQLNPDGLTLMKRSLEWAGGSGATAGPVYSVLMFVPDPGNLNVPATDRKALMEFWGHTVTLIDDDDTALNITNAVDAADVVYVGSGSVGTTIGTKLDGATKGVVNEPISVAEMLGFASSWTVASIDQLTIVDGTHSITQGLANPVTVFTSSKTITTLSGTFSPDLQNLAEAGATPAIAALETGATRHDVGTTSGRRAQLPFASAVGSDLTADGQLIVQRAIEWAAGTGVAAPPGYNVLLIVGNDTTLASKDVGYKALMESWGHTVSVLDDGASQADYDTAMAAANVVYASGSASGPSMLDKATYTTKGMVNEVNGKIDNFGFSSSTSATANFDTFSITNPGHYITEPFSGNPVTVFTSSLTNPIPGGTLAPDLQNVGEITGTLALGTLDAGATRYDSTPSQGRRAHLPFTAAETTDMTADGMTILQRAIEWAAGAGGGGGGGGGGGSCDGNFRDNFDTRSFSGSNGTLSWATDWIEVGESDGAASGDTQVRTDQSNYQLRTRDNNNGGEGVEREADLSGAASATLSYDYRRMNLDSSSDYTSVQISPNGASGPWTELTRHQGSGNDSSYQPASHPITAYKSANTRVRFITSSSMGGTDTVWFDNVEIVCTP